VSTTPLKVRPRLRGSAARLRLAQAGEVALAQPDLHTLGLDALDGNLQRSGVDEDGQCQRGDLIHDEFEAPGVDLLDEHAA
jgi:hypothetical protein